ncbi:signal peptidase I [Sphingoaurantiacus capsulatus]|uniref:Signal peptidase I n=1 Tax=Sphingoaurantiacus capsulatus TaxID=1771310 RepID=A0ABV7X6M5_9SPHN
MTEPKVSNAPLSEAEAARAAHMARTETLYASFKEGVKTIFGAILIALFVRSFAYEPFNIPSESMLSRLRVGDYLFVSKWPYGFSRYSLPLGLPLFDGRLLGAEPQRGEIAVFKTPADNRTDFIKRVIGLPGDLIQMKSGVLHINGAAVKKERVADLVMPVTPNTDCLGGFSRPSFRAVSASGQAVCRYPQYRETLPGGASYLVLDQVTGSTGDDTGIYVVPQGHYFMMGDNRDDSADSRYAVSQDGIGFVPYENLVGRASLMFFSTDGSAKLFNPISWFTAIRWDRVGKTFSA